MGLSMGFQMASVLKAGARNQRVSIVSGFSKAGDWKEVHASSLPQMFKNQRRIFAAQLEQRFKVDGTPDAYTLLALKLDPASGQRRGPEATRQPRGSISPE
mmetsp:Transcript_18848/g.40610  ORF Transcript_18848/g.40610 Transcript_18848/m.40610 type:complete len:101 (+) Transcript_18848:874-1176(+)